MQSLRDKLLKAGLVSPEAAQKAEADKRESAEAHPQPPRGRARERSEREPSHSASPSTLPKAQVHTPAHPPHRAARAAAPSPVRGELRVPKLPPLPGTAAAHRLASKEQLLVDRRIRERVLATEVPKEPGATTFYFVTRRNKLRRLELSAEQAKLLEDGLLAIVERPDPDKIEHALVPPAVALELRALSQKTVRFLKSGEARVGFLSDEEISQRAHEADSDDTSEAHDAADAHDGGSASEAASAATSAPSTGSATDRPAAAAPALEGAEPATFIRVRRAPL